MHCRHGSEAFLIAGCSNSGKTTVMSMLMRSVFELDAPSPKILYDPMAEMLPVIYDLAGDSEDDARLGTGRVKVLNPFDVRGCAWSMSDIDSPLAANQLAEVLVPQSGDDKEGRFYDEAVRSLVAGLAHSFIDCVPNPQSWTFRDLVLALTYEPYTRFMLEMDSTRGGNPFPVAAQLRKAYLQGDERVVSNIRATITTKFRNFAIIAACFHAAEREGRTFSLKEWAQQGGEGVLVVGNDDTAKETLETLNRAIFRRAFELLLALPGLTPEELRSGAKRSWVFLDEVRNAGYLDKLSLLITKGRSRGICTALAFQEIDGMRHEYGKELANEICAQCGNVVVLRLNSGETAEWASGMFGRGRGPSSGSNRSFDSQGNENRGRDEREEEQSYVDPAEFLYIPPTGPDTGLTGFAKSPDVNPDVHDLRIHLDWQTEVMPYLARRPSLPQDSWRAARIQRPVSDQYLLPWGEEDWKRLGFTCPIPDWRGQRKPPESPPGPGGIPQL